MSEYNVEFQCTPEQYHARLKMMWQAVDGVEREGRDIFQIVCDELKRLYNIEPPKALKSQRSPIHELKSKVVQIQAANQPGDYICGPHVQLFALCEDGTIWVQYNSSGSSNVPTDGRWYPV